MGRPDLAAGPARTSRPGYGRAVPVLAAAFCPHPPLLAPELAGGAAHELDDLRAHCDGVVGALAAYDVPVLVLGRGPTGRSYGSAGLRHPRSMGGRRPGRRDRPGVPAAEPHPRRLAPGPRRGGPGGPRVPVGGRRRGPRRRARGGRRPAGHGRRLVRAYAKAPGGLHPAAEGYDAAVVAALAAGDALALLAAADPSGAAAVGRRRGSHLAGSSGARPRTPTGGGAAARGGGALRRRLSGRVLVLVAPPPATARRSRSQSRPRSRPSR